MTDEEVDEEEVEGEIVESEDSDDEFMLTLDNEDGDDE